MSNWTALAKAHFSETGHAPTARTDKTTLSSVSSVPIHTLSEKSKAVSSVGVVALFENRALSADLMTAAMRCCDFHGDTPAAREQMRQDVLKTPPHLRGDLLAHFEKTYPKGST